MTGTQKTIDEIVQDVLKSAEDGTLHQDGKYKGGGGYAQKRKFHASEEMSGFHMDFLAYLAEDLHPLTEEMHLTTFPSPAGSESIILYLTTSKPTFDPITGLPVYEKDKFIAAGIGTPHDSDSKWAATFGHQERTSKRSYKNRAGIESGFLRRFAAMMSQKGMRVQVPTAYSDEERIEQYNDDKGTPWGVSMYRLK